ncbi:SDR family oxidoreductase (plasmid) [Streptomyces sp. BI20]|uniref:SDR family oxidoreductase n=1 Tax=Streptomyces sp. BI20 TaxID=3403460 RepID=UPI003C739FFF
MPPRTVTPTQRGFLIVNSHPEGCAASVRRTWQAVPNGAAAHDPATEGAARAGRPPVVLVLGASAGYGLAILAAALRGHGARAVGVAFEAPENARRTASAGWYRTAALADLARAEGHDVTFVNADAFSDTAKTEVLDLIAERYGPVDHLVYSLAAPRRTDPATGTTHQSVIKPLGAPYESPALRFSDDGTPEAGTVRLEPADDAERADTVAVMGGADWRRWVEALEARDLLAEGFATVALSYVGSELTAPVYRQGTIGAAKEHLEHTARELHAHLAARGGRAHTVVAGAAVTQASTAIPSIALYTGLLYDVLGPEGFRTPVDQAVDLWDRLTGAAPLDLDDRSRVRLDRWELDETVQDRVRALWADPAGSVAGSERGVAWFAAQVRELYGWDQAGVDYARPTETTVPWPAPRPA